LTVINTPILWINEYLKEKISEDVFGSTNAVPFLPTGPSIINAITEQFVSNEEEVIAVYDRMFRKRKRAFPHIKCEQVLYYFYANGSNDKLNMIKIQEAVMRTMDNEDETAEDLNKWAAQKGSITFNDYVNGVPQTVTVTPDFYFHGFKIYHLEEARDIIDFGTARTFAANKIIIDYDYHRID